jgi:outer membrane immunogenic protein
LGNLKRSLTFANVTSTGNVDGLATIRGRLGVAFTSPTLLYITGGLALGQVRSRWTDNFGDAIAVNATKVGAVAGAGIEHAFAGKWSVRAEFLYHDLGNIAGQFYNGTTYTTNFRHRISTARAGLALRW